MFETLNEAVAAEIDALLAEATKRLEGKLWELRLTGKNGISRAIYVTATGKRVVVVWAFPKKAQKTPAKGQELTRKRATEVV